MAKLERKPQVAECVGVRNYVGKNGEPKEMYEMSLDGSLNTFLVFETAHFKAQKGELFSPIIIVYPKATPDKNDPSKAWVRYQTIINWEKIS